MAPTKDYSPEMMAKAVEAVRVDGMSVSSAAKSFGVPRITLHNKISGKSPLVCGMGPSTVLTPTEEDYLEKWVIAMGERRFPISKDQLLDSVQQIVTEQNRTTPFTSNRPGKKWYSSFLKRHPVLTERTAENISSARSDVTEDQINNWFIEIENYLTENNLSGILEDPNKIFNTDESAFFLSPKPGRVLMKRGVKNVYMASRDEKENVTVLVTANAAGKLAPPMVVYAYKRIPANISKKVPDKWGVGISDSGWMCGETFFEYVTNIFNPWLIEENIPKPVLLFVDGHKSHLTLHLSNFCSENGIHVVALFPNSTHILQPMDIAVFRPLKVFYRKAVVQWKMENNGSQIKKEDFAPVFKNALERITKDCIKNGFRGGGLYPFGPDYVDFSKLRIQSDPNENADRVQEQFLNYLEKQIKNTFGQDKLAMYNRLYFEGRNVLENMALDEDMNLYILWASNKQKVIIPHTSAGISMSQPELTASTAASNDAGPSTSRPESTASRAASNDAGLSTSRPEPTASTAASNDAGPFTSRPELTASTAVSNDAGPSTSRPELTASTAASNDAGPSTSRPELTASTAASNDAGLSTSRPEPTASTAASNDAGPSTSRPELTASTAASNDAGLSTSRPEPTASTAASNDAGPSTSRPELTASTAASNDAGLSTSRPEPTASTAASNDAGPSTSRPEPTASTAASKDAGLSTSRPEPTASTAASNDAGPFTSRPEPTASAAASNDAGLSTSRPEPTASTAASNDAGPFTSPPEPTASTAASNDAGPSTSRPEPIASTAAFNDAGPSTSQPEPTASTAASNDAGPSTSRLEPIASTLASKRFLSQGSTPLNNSTPHFTPEKTGTDDVPDISSSFAVSMLHSGITPNRNGCTPQKHTLSNVLGSNVPSPFKRCLFWPEDLKKKQNIRKKDKVPSAVTSLAWKKYHHDKEEEKRRVLEEKELRAKMRLEKKMKKVEIEKGKKMKVNIKKKKLQDSSSSEDTDDNIQYNESDESEYNVQLDEVDFNEVEFITENKNGEKQQNKRKKLEKGKKKKVNIKKKKLQDSSSSEDTGDNIQYNESDESEYNVQLDEVDFNEVEFITENKNGEKQQNKRKKLEDSDSETELPLAKLKAKSKAENRKHGLKRGCFVIIVYEGEYFPGKIENMDRGRYEISTMILSTGHSFRWPERPDKLFYSTDEIVEIIEPPIPHNNRGFYKVKEMDKYLPDIYEYS